jgi:hypothetical protein
MKITDHLPKKRNCSGGYDPPRKLARLPPLASSGQRSSVRAKSRSRKPQRQSNLTDFFHKPEEECDPLASDVSSQMLTMQQCPGECKEVAAQEDDGEMEDLKVERAFQEKHGECSAHGKGPTELLPYEIKALWNTKVMQRLGDLKQLGACSHVFPKATHTRLQHSVGVCYLAKVLLDRLEDQIHRMHAAFNGSVPPGCPAESLPGPIDDRDKVCVMIAALGHDAGHGPKSHLFEDAVRQVILDKDAEAWNHEAMSIKMVQQMLSESNLTYLNEQDHTFIYECIAGKDLHAVPGVAKQKKYSAAEVQRARRGRPRDKAYLYDIVCNIFSGLDVDKIDYLMRDPLCISKDQLRRKLCERAEAFTALCEHAQVRWCLPPRGVSGGGSGGEEGRWGICWPKDMRETVNMLFKQRQDMHELVYNHPSVKPFERLYIKLFALADHMCFADGKFQPSSTPQQADGVNKGVEGRGLEGRSFAESIGAVDSFMVLHDGVVDCIAATCPEAQALALQLDANAAHEHVVGMVPIPTPGGEAVVVRGVSPSVGGAEVEADGRCLVLQGPVRIHRGLVLPEPDSPHS